MATLKVRRHDNFGDLVVSLAVFSQHILAQKIAQERRLKRVRTKHVPTVSRHSCRPRQCRLRSHVVRRSQG